MLTYLLMHIYLIVSTLDKYFKNVTEIDLVYDFTRVLFFSFTIKIFPFLSFFLLSFYCYY